MSDLSPVHHVVLRFLLAGPAHGYALHKRIAALGRFYPLRNVNIYAVLRELEGGGLAVSRTELKSHRARKVYGITPDGEEALRAWVSRAPAEDTFPFQQDLTALKLLVATEGSLREVAWLGESLDALEAEIEWSRRQLERLGEVLTPIGALTLEWRLAMYEQRRDYLLEARRLLEGEGAERAAAVATR